MGSVLETLNQGVVISDEDRRIVFANSMFLEMSKMLAEEVLGRSVMDLYPPDDVGRLQEFIARREAQGRARYEFYVPQGDGGRLPVAVTSCLVHGGDGRAYGVVTATDISDQKRAIGGSARPFFRGFFARSSTRCEHKFSKDAKAETLVFRSHPTYRGQRSCGGPRSTFRMKSCYGKVGRFATFARLIFEDSLSPVSQSTCNWNTRAQFVSRANAVYDAAAVSPPFVMGMIQRPLTGVYAAIGGLGEEHTAPVAAGDYRFPIMQVDDLSEVDRTIRAFCDQAHQMFGREGSPSFNAEGVWVARY